MSLLPISELDLLPKVNVAYLTGPFFLGFALEAFGMGVVLILSINYFYTLANRPKSPHESSRRLGVALAAVSLVLNMVQTILDLIRGWDMFGNHFLNIPGFMIATPIFFVSPFVGLIPSALTQIFLLRRITLFLSSLDHLWPRLAHPVVKYSFVGTVGLAIVLTFAAGTMSSALVYTGGSLIGLGAQGATLFARVEQLWLGSSTGVDLVLSSVLCVELWWARQKLGMQGGVMREIVTRLILVTCHGGLAVSGLQLASLLLYQLWRHNSFCYLPILFLPKVYNITLLLSLSVPHSSEIAPNPSHVFSLPTILDHQATAQEGAATSPLANSIRPFPEPKREAREGTMKRHALKVQGLAESGARRWKPWFSFGGFISGSRDEKGDRVDHPASSHIKKNQSQHDDHDGFPQRFAHLDPSRDDRRPSDPNSIAPLLPHRGAPASPAISGITPTRSPMFVTNPLYRDEGTSSSVVWHRPLSMSTYGPGTPDPTFVYPQTRTEAGPSMTPLSERTNPFGSLSGTSHEDLYPPLISPLTLGRPHHPNRARADSTVTSEGYLGSLRRGLERLSEDEERGLGLQRTRTLSSTYHRSGSGSERGSDAASVRLSFDRAEDPDDPGRGGGHKDRMLSLAEMLEGGPDERRSGETQLTGG